MDKQLLEMLACPKCKGPVAATDGEKSFVCEKCKIRYPIRNGIPCMMVEEAMDTRSGVNFFEGSIDKYPRASFRVVSGPDANLAFHLDRGTCRAIGRAAADPNKTSVFNVDIALELDETTRRLVLQYVSKQFRKAAQTEQRSRDQLGSFRRVPDVVLTDQSLSRLHSMMFYDDVGIGILDLVSKNGTFVNGKEIESILLHPGDVIELGESTISYEK
jgi:uncharacterized protein YbaR (Trm112 family)